jgi:prolyl-tRNA synthetase
MRLSQYFLPTLKENPAEAHIASHRLMLRAGMINQTTSGIYTWLPLGELVLKRIDQIVALEQDRIGCHRVTMPTVQPAHLWQESGRYEDYGKEMLRIQDRHEREMLYGPTHEEVITDVVRQYISSYRQLPLCLYQIHWKFRDEIRPRFGVMRGREFYMKDAYSFDIDMESARQSYEKMYNAYLRTFAKMGLKAVPMRADSGAIGGDLSHEFHVVADTGESAIYYDRAFETLTEDDYSMAKLGKLYAVSDEKHDPATCPISPDQLVSRRGIEVGHIFYFGTKYSKSMGLKVSGPDGKPIYPEMGSYGIGVSRLVAAIIESSQDEHGIIWPEEVAPFRIGLIDAKNDAQTQAISEQLHERLTNAGISVLYDDRSERAGVKFSDMDLIGLPWHVIVGGKTLTNGTVEIKNRRTGAREDLSLDGVVDRFLPKPA